MSVIANTYFSPNLRKSTPPNGRRISNLGSLISITGEFSSISERLWILIRDTFSILRATSTNAFITIIIKGNSPYIMLGIGNHIGYKRLSNIDIFRTSFNIVRGTSSLTHPRCRTSGFPLEINKLGGDAKSLRGKIGKSSLHWCHWLLSVSNIIKTPPLSPIGWWSRKIGLSNNTCSPSSFNKTSVRKSFTFPLMLSGNCTQSKNFKH